MNTATAEPTTRNSELMLSRAAMMETARRAALKHPLSFLKWFYHPVLDAPARRLVETLEPWQYQHIIRPMLDPTIRRVYIECVRDADKTGLTSAGAFTLCWFNKFYSVRQYAADRDQAGTCRDAIRKRILSHEPTIDRQITMPMLDIRFPNNSSYKIEASDAAGAWGKFSDLVIPDELHAWKKQSSVDLFNSIITKLGVKIVVITNPGDKKEGLCWDIRERWREAYERGDKDFYFFSMENCPRLPSWLTDEYLEKQKAQMPAPVFKRFHLCQWTTAHDGLFTEADVDAIFDERVRDLISGGEVVYGGADYAYRRDRAAVALALPMPENHYNIVNMMAWEANGADIDLNEIARHISRQCEAFPCFKTFAFDPYQAMAHIQSLRSYYGEERIKEFVFSEAHRRQLFMNLYSVIKSRRLHVSPHTPFARLLRDQLLGLDVNAAWKVEHGTEGDDLPVAIGIALTEASEAGAGVVDWHGVSLSGVKKPMRAASFKNL